MIDVTGGFVQIAETKQIFEAELIRLRLLAGGVEAQLLDQTFAQEPMPDVRSFSLVRVFVPAGDLALARDLLAQSVALPEDVEMAEESS